MMPTRACAALVITVTLAGCGRKGPPSFAGFVDAPVAAVAAQAAGRLSSVEVAEGAPVEKGQVLARLDSREREAMLEQAEANVERARAALVEAERNRGAVAPTLRGAAADIARQRADLEQARLDVERAEALASKGALTAAELEVARTRLAEARAAVEGTTAAHLATRGRVSASEAAVLTAQAAVRSAEAAQLLARVQLEQTEISSPFTGRLVQRNLEPGEWVAPGTPVVTVEDASRQWVRLDVEETLLASVQLGAPCEVRIVALPGLSFAGHVMEIGAEAEFALNRDVKRGRPDVRTFRVRVALERIEPRLRPGMTAEVTLAPAAPDAGPELLEPRAESSRPAQSLAPPPFRSARGGAAR